MALKDEIGEIITYVKDQRDRIKHDSILIDIYEGNLLTYVENHLKREFSDQTYKQVAPRIAPINVLTRIVDKMSKIYQQNPNREIVDGSENDELLLKQYESSFDIDENMNISNELMNLAKYSLVQVYLHQGMPKLRPIPNDKFTLMSKDVVDPTNPTHVILFAGTVKVGQDEVEVWHIYTDNEFLVITEKGDILRDQMEMVNNPEGINPFGKLPFVYANKSKLRLIPKIDTDTLRMTLILPILLSDLNYAVKYQSFSIFFGIDINDENIVFAPNAFLRFKSDELTEKQPQFGTIKPQVDINEVLTLIQSEMALWLNTKGIRPGSVGALQQDNFASGVSKMIDEMDVTENRKKQVEIYQNVEQDMWDLVINHMHPYWVKNGMLETNQMFSIDAKVMTNFKEPIPVFNRGDLVRDLRDEVTAGFISQRRAIKRLNPRITEEDLDNMLNEIDEERGILPASEE